MSLVTLIRDYVDVVNSSEQLDGYTLSSLAYYTFTFLFTVIKEALVYCFTFHWLRDFSYFCLTPPVASYGSSLGQHSFGTLSAFTSGLLTSKNGGIELASLPADQPLSNLLAFSDSNFATGIGVIILGFLNGCFSCMHLSAANLVTIQRMLVQGVPAGLCSAFGTAVGQFFFLLCVLFGFRGLLFPWLALEPLHFLLGIGILLSIASATAQDRRTPTVKWSAKSSLLIYVFTSFALVWCEQTAIFQWIGNISFGTEPTFLETTPSLENIQTVFGDVQQLVLSLSYLLAFFVGNIVGAFLIGYAVQRLLELVLRYRGIAIYYGLVKQANLPLATLVFAFGFGSLPYYGFDYLVTKGLGFVPHERFFQQTLFSPANLVSKTSQAKEPSQGRLEDQLALLFTLEGERSKSFAVDTTPFDDGQYLKAGQKRPQAFEDINYRGEHLWTNRLSRISNMREQANQTQSSFLGPVFSWMRSFLWGDGTAVNNTGMLSMTDSFGSATPRDAFLADRKDREDQVSPIHFSSPRTTLMLSHSGKQKKEFSPEKEQIDNYIKEFDRQFDKGFSNFYNADPYSLIEVEDQWQEKRIKEKCYTNPIYKFLLNTEIDTFLTRQPNSHWLSPEEEVLLLKRRQLLSNYYDTLALTNKVSTSEAFGQLVPKSYANAIYNHQFKGTLKVARRLFSVKKAVAKELPYSEKPMASVGGEKTHSLIEREIAEPNSLLKKSNDRLSSEGELSTASFSKASVHPSDAQNRNEVEKGLLFNFRSEGKDGLLEDKLSANRRVIKFDQPLFLKEKKTTQQILFHEELGSNLEAQQGAELSANGKTNIFLLKQAEPFPLYASWDDQLRKLIVTNRFQSRALAGYTFAESMPLSEFPKISTFFTTWPIPNPFFDKNKLNHTIANASFGSQKLSASDEEKRTHINFETDKTGTNEDLSTSSGFPERKASNGLAVLSQHSSNNIHKTGGIIGKDSNKSATPHENQLTSFRSEEKDRVAKPNEKSTDFLKVHKGKNSSLVKPAKFLQKSIDAITQSLFHQSPKNRFLFQTDSLRARSERKDALASQSNDMVNALLQWQKLIKENKQLSKEDKQAAKEKIVYWPENIYRSSWSNELIDNDMEFDEPIENVAKKQTLLWEFTPPNHGGFLWSGSNSASFAPHRVAKPSNK